MAPPSGKHWSVRIDGIVPKIDALRKMDKKIYNAMVREIENAAKAVSSDAAARVPDNPLSNWGRWTSASSARGRGSVTVVSAGGGRDLSYEQGSVRAGFKHKAGRKFRQGTLSKFSVVVSQMSPAGAIYELAGSVGQYWGAGNKGRSFTSNMSNKNGSAYPRALGAAYYAKGPSAAEKIEKIIDQYTSQVNNAG